MWFCCKQPRTKRKKERKWQLLPFQWKGWGNIQPRHCHLQEVKGSLRRLMPECFHLAIAAANQMVACGQIQAGNLSMVCWRWGRGNTNQNLLSFGKYCLSLLTIFTSSVITVEVMVVNKRRWRWASSFLSLTRGSHWTPCCTLMSDTEPSDG